MTDVPDLAPSLELMSVSGSCPDGYNELLYAHLLDNDGTRLTYTHFTAKVKDGWMDGWIDGWMDGSAHPGLIMS